MIAAIKLFFGNYTLIIAAAVLAALVAALGVQTLRLSSAHTDITNLKTSIADERRASAEQRTVDEQSSRAAENLMADLASTERKAAHAKVVALNSRVADLLVQLHNRPERPAAGSEVAPAAGPGPSGTGAGLYRQDSEFLIGDAAAAAQVGIERDECRRRYESARSALRREQSQ